MNRKLDGLRARLATVFFANFFRLLVVAISGTQAVMLAWLWPRTRMSPQPAVYLLGAAALYGLNRSVLRWTADCRRRGKHVGVVPHLYYAAALTCLFCVSYLGVLAVLWTPVRMFLGALAVQARPTHVGTLAAGTTPVFSWLANTGMAGIALAFIYGYTIGQRRLRITRLTLALRNLPTALDGLRIAQISDIHLGDNLTTRQLAEFVARVNALQPDLICITGDIVDSPYTDVDDLLPRLAELRAVYGVIAILGNHDHYSGADRVEARLRHLTRFIVLRDEWTTITIRDERLHIVGLDDRGRDWARGVPAVAYLDSVLPAFPKEEPVLLLCHRPDIFPQAAAAGVALTLSGHTHGGQLGIPWFNGRVRNLAEFITPFDRGLFERDGSYLYVNCGLGVTGQRIRLCTPREITLIEARSTHPVACAS